MQRIENNPLPQNERATCHKCGETIYWNHEEGVHNGSSGVWLTVKDKVVNWNSYYEGSLTPYLCGNRSRHEPKEWCWLHVTESSSYLCGRPVKYEEIVAEIYACGRHRRRGESEKLERDRRKREEEKARTEKEIFEFEKGKYLEAADWLRNNGYEHLVASYNVERYRNSLNRFVNVDLIELRNILERKQEEWNNTSEGESPSTALEESWLTILEEDTST